MLHIRDISLRHRLLITNFTMVFVHRYFDGPGIPSQDSAFHRLTMI